MSRVLSITIPVLMLLVYDISMTFAQDPIVYSRCERTTDTYTVTADITINGEVHTRTETFGGLDVYDVLPDVTNFFHSFNAPCDLVYRDAVGEETIIYNCSSTSTAESACAALDPTVSFDAKTIAFSVFRGPIKYHRENVNARVLDPDADNQSLGFANLPNKQLASEGSHIHFYNVETGVVTEIPYEIGIFDSGPAFVSATRIAFTSTRDGNASTQVWGTNTKPGTRIWAMNVDGTNLDLSSHHSLSQEQHPFMLKDGRLAYSSWQIFGGLPFRHTNGRPQGFTTLGNMFHIYTQDPDGAGNFAFYGQHSGDHLPSTFGEDHNAAHFITQTTDERVWFTDYYRGNNNGLGAMVGVVPEPEGQEGINPHTATTRADMYVPRDVINMASWAINGDTGSPVLASNPIVSPSYADPIPFAGKLGHPAALPDNGLMVSWGKGNCTTVIKGRAIFAQLGLPEPQFADGSGSGVGLSFMRQLNLDIPACDIGIYRVTSIPSAHPSDLELIVDSPDWHEIMVRAVVPYSDIHSVNTPVVREVSHERTTHAFLEAGTPFGLLGAASIIDRETHPRGGIHFAGEHQFNSQGTDTIDYTDEDLCGVRILGVMPNRYTNRSANRIIEVRNIAGERLSILGELDVKNRNSEGVRVIDPSGSPDTSFFLRMPANTPYITQAIDCDGRTLNTDQTWQQVRPGEVKTCGGCHVHSRPALNEFVDTFASTAEYEIRQLGEGQVPLLTGLVGDTVTSTLINGYGIQIDFERDVMPILQRRCVECHGDTEPARNLNLGVSGIDVGSTWHCLTSDTDQNCGHPDDVIITDHGPNDRTLRRPQLTRYVRAFNSRGSLLYWKAANERTDNRTDEGHTDDINFGVAHPTSITPDELGVISRWIDIGVPGGDFNIVDTQKPTINLSAVIDQNDAITGFNIGTVDLGAGIDVNSLVLCIRASDGTCSNLAGQAEMHGVTTVALSSPLTDVDSVIFASVMDLSGNITELSRTFSWYVNSN